mgnify:CR=1 FL=1
MIPPRAGPKAGWRLAELIPRASRTGALRSSGTTGPNDAGLWCIVTRRLGALPATSTSMIALPDFCRTVPFGTPFAMART